VFLCRLARTPNHINKQGETALHYAAKNNQYPFCQKINRSYAHTHTHTGREQHPRHRHTHTRHEQHPKPPNKHPPQTLNNARRWRDDGACRRHGYYWKGGILKFPFRVSVQAGAHPNHINKQGETALHYAAKNNQYPFCQKINRSHAHTHTHTPAENNAPDTDTHTHDTNNTPNLQTNTPHEH